MVWESQKTNQKQENSKHNLEQNQQNNYTKHYVYEPNSFVPLFQTGYAGFIKLIETPDYSRFKTEAYSIQKDPVWRNDTRRNRAKLERVAFYHCDQVGTPQTLTNERGECVWEIKQNTWGTTQAITVTNLDNPLEQSNIRFQGQYYDEETGLHYNRYRYYEPHSARYVSKDPIGLMGGLNNSSYVSDPNQWIDPMGLVDVFSSAECTYKISAQNLKCTKTTTSLGSTGIERELESIQFTKEDGIFSGRSDCKDNSSKKCLETKDIGPPLPGTYDMKRVDKYGGSWWLDEGMINRRLRNRSEFYLHEGSISHGCITVNKMNDFGTSKFYKLKQLFDGMNPKMIIEK